MTDTRSGIKIVLLVLLVIFVLKKTLITNN